MGDGRTAAHGFGRQVLFAMPSWLRQKLEGKASEPPQASAGGAAWSATAFSAPVRRDRAMQGDRGCPAAPYHRDVGDRAARQKTSSDFSRPAAARHRLDMAFRMAGAWGSKSAPASVKTMP